MYSIVIQPRAIGEWKRIEGGKIFDSKTKTGATRKANSYLKDTDLEIVSKYQNGNYEYWTCVDFLHVDQFKAWRDSQNLAYQR